MMNPLAVEYHWDASGFNILWDYLIGKFCPSLQLFGDLCGVDIAALELN